jgi:hypothetical protein
MLETGAQLGAQLAQSPATRKAIQNVRVGKRSERN